MLLQSQPNLNGLRVTERRGNTIFVRLPRALWQLCGDDGVCRCAKCEASGRAAFWDTLAIVADPAALPANCKRANDTTWMVHHPDHTAYDLVRVVELDEQGNATSYEATTVEGPGRWSVRIPYVYPVPTEWHPTERDGAFATLSRGSFATEAEAILWAESKLLGHPYRLAFHRSYPEE